MAAGGGGCKGGDFVPLALERSCRGNWIIADLVVETLLVGLRDRSVWQDSNKTLKWLKLKHSR